MAERAMREGLSVALATRHRGGTENRLDADDPCPARDGFAMPAEWERHERTWMCWPCRTEVWGGPEKVAAPNRPMRGLRGLSGVEPVTMAARPRGCGGSKICHGRQDRSFEVALDDLGRAIPADHSCRAGRQAGGHPVAVQCLGQQIQSL